MGNIYVLKQDGVFRYHNRNPDNDLTTRDHRLEKIKNDDIDKWYARLDAGFFAGNMLLQGSSKGVGSWFTTDLKDDERKNMREVTGIKADDVPLAIVSIGKKLDIGKWEELPSVRRYFYEVSP